MHEMAIAEGILGICEDYARANEAKQVKQIGLLLGEMSGVETEALEFCFASLSKGTLAEGAEFIIKRVPLMGKCNKCGFEQHIEHYNFICPNCTDGVLQVTGGRELQVEYLEVE